MLEQKKTIVGVTTWLLEQKNHCWSKKIIAGAKKSDWSKKTIAEAKKNVCRSKKIISFSILTLLPGSNVP